MKEIHLGPGLAPDCVILDGLIYVAYGQATPPALVVVSLTLEGVVVSERTIPAGFYNAWPRFSGPWLGFKQGPPSYGPMLINVETGETVTYPGQADGNFGIAVNASLGILAYQNGAYPIWFGAFIGGASDSGLAGAPDGLDTIVSRWEVTLRKDTRQDVAGMLYPVYADDLVVGEWIGGYGIACQLTHDVLRVAAEGLNSPFPRCASDGTTYVMVVGGDASVTLLIGSRADVEALPPAVPPQPKPPEPIPPQPIPVPPNPIPIPPKPEPKPPILHEDQIMATSQVQGIIHYVSKKASVQPGCTNYILKDGSVFSCQSDGSAGSRPAGTDGPWEQGQESGACATFNAGAYYTWLVAPIDKLQA